MSISEYPESEERFLRAYVHMHFSGKKFVAFLRFSKMFMTMKRSCRGKSFGIRIA